MASMFTFHATCSATECQSPFTGEGCSGGVGLPWRAACVTAVCSSRPKADLRDGPQMVGDNKGDNKGDKMLDGDDMLKG
jgi:hypothetical protein